MIDNNWEDGEKNEKNKIKTVLFIKQNLFNFIHFSNLSSEFYSVFFLTTNYQLWPKLSIPALLSKSQNYDHTVESEWLIVILIFS